MAVSTVKSFLVIGIVFLFTFDNRRFFTMLGTLVGGRIGIPRSGLSATKSGLTIAIRYADGVVMAGDRRATSGNLISHRAMEKVYPADRYSGVAIAGAAGPAMDMVKLFQVELEHYEKIEGVRLSLEGKASFLARLVKGQLPMAFQGLVVVPLFGGYDMKEGRGRVYTYDLIGGRYEETDFGSTGSGSRLAKSYLRTAYEEDITGDAAMALAINALVAASTEDTATGGPDLKRGILPNVVRIDAAHASPCSSRRAKAEPSPCASTTRR